MPGLERAGLEAGAIGAVQVGDVHALRRGPPHRQLARSIASRRSSRPAPGLRSGRADSPSGRPTRSAGRRRTSRCRSGAARVTAGSSSKRLSGNRHLVPVLHVRVDEVVPMPPVAGQNDQNEEVGGENQRFKRSHRTEGPSLNDQSNDYTFGAAKVKDIKDLSRFCRTMTPTEIRAILGRMARGELALDAAVDELAGRFRTQPFEDLGFARVDHHRAARQGFPEVVLGLGKTPEQAAAIAARIVAKGHSLLVTRADRAMFEAIRAEAAGGRVPRGRAGRHPQERRRHARPRNGARSPPLAPRTCRSRKRRWSRPR